MDQELQGGLFIVLQSSQLCGKDVRIERSAVVELRGKAEGLSTEVTKAHSAYAMETQMHQRGLVVGAEHAETRRSQTKPHRLNTEAAFVRGERKLCLYRIDVRQGEVLT